jgi:YesN/AraC family two-component response regulator
MARKIKDENFEQAIIFVTAHDETEYLHSAIKLGADGFLTKPLEMNELKSVLYKTTQAISDRNLVKKHYNQIEESNIELIGNKRSFRSAKAILEDLENSKEDISKIWAASSVVQERLKNHTIDVEYFRTHYGMKVIEYFLGVIKGNSEIGNCPVVIAMIEFFKHKHLPLEDIFMICVHFKNTVNAYIFDKYDFNNELYEDVSVILDRNFEGVIINYMKMKGHKNRNVSKSEEKPQIECAETEEKKEKAILDKINYVEYVLESDVYELQELEEDIDRLAILVTGSKTTIDDSFQLGTTTKRYGEILSNYPIFSDLGKCIIKLGTSLIDNAQILIDDKAKMLNITALIEGFVNDLIIWRKEIFINNIEDYKFLDKSISSNVDMIVMFIEYDESADVSDEGDFEFF